jgi:predicted transcriptional regulator of viral defense system
MLAVSTNGTCATGNVAYVPPVRLDDELLSSGRVTFTIGDVVDLTGRPESSVRNTLARMARVGTLYRPAKGFYVVVPSAQRRSRGAPSPDLYLDALMRFLKRRYYVGWLTAAALHGATHHGPQRFQVGVDSRVRLVEADRGPLDFYQTEFAGTSAAPVERRSTPSGPMAVATRELTAVDLASDPRRGGGPGNVAAVLADLGDLEIEELARLLSFRPTSDAQRLGHLLAMNRRDVDLDPLRDVLAERGSSPVVLDVRRPSEGPVDREWDVIVNAVDVVEERSG